MQGRHTVSPLGGALIKNILGKGVAAPGVHCTGVQAANGPGMVDVLPQGAIADWQWKYISNRFIHVPWAFIRRWRQGEGNLANVIHTLSFVWVLQR